MRFMVVSWLVSVWISKADASLDARWPSTSRPSVLSANDVSSCASTLALSKLNDNYCDCLDGSDDEWLTGACGVGYFTCAWSGLQLPSSFVLDGVCDCCDGSDEGPTNTCRNRCESVAAQTNARLHDVLQNALEGLKVKDAYIDNVGATSQLDSWRASLAQAVEHWEGAAEAAEDQLDALTHRYQINPSLTPTDQDRRLYHQLYAQMQHAKSQWSKVSTLASTSFGDHDEFASLMGHCFEYEVNEKELKGGTSNTIARTYLMVFCPFVNVTQTEPGYHGWRLAQKQAQVGDKYVVEDDGTDQEVQPPILLGLWGEWAARNPHDNHAILVPAPLYVEGVPHAAETRVASALRPPNQLYGRGDLCGGRDDPNRRYRRVTVEMHCDSYNHVAYMEERAWCDYVLGFSTPAACTKEYVAHLQSATDRNDVTTMHDEL